MLVAVLLSAGATLIQAQTSQQWRDSLQVLNRMIDQWPRSTDLRLKKAAVNIQLGQWDYAVEEYANVLRLDEKNPAALYYRAYALTHLRQYAQARADYEKLLQEVPLHMEGRLGLALVNEKMGRTRDALDGYNQLVEMFPDSALCYAARAAFESTQQQYDVALYDWDEAIRRQPSNADYVVTKADLLIALGRYDEARSTLEKALQQGVPRGVLREWFDKCRKAATTR
jgi:tetratricopeptide (TPR) repeat protein